MPIAVRETALVTERVDLPLPYPARLTVRRIDQPRAAGNPGVGTLPDPHGIGRKNRG